MTTLMHLGKVEKLVGYHCCQACSKWATWNHMLFPRKYHQNDVIFHGYVGLPECRTIKSWQSRDCWLNVEEKGFHTVDGSEIRPSPVDMVNILLLFTGFYSGVIIKEVQLMVQKSGDHQLRLVGWCSISSINTIGPNATLLPSLKPLKLAAVFFRK